MIVLTKKQKNALFKKVITDNPSNSFVYSQLLQTMINNRNQIVPFIGAGLSMFAFNTWGGLLKNLLAQLDQSTNLDEETKQEKISELIEKGDYFQAADNLEGMIDSDVFYYSLASAFTESVFVKDGTPDIPASAAARWLPKVFPNSRIITTNYDTVLEWAYAQHNLYLRVCTPSDDRMFMQFMPRRLFKIHGSYDSNYEDIVLTSKSYDAKYDPSSALYNNFKILVRNSVLFFIGASLRADKTLDLLKELSGELTTSGGHYSGNMHFAILHIEDSEDKNERKKELAQYKIMPILYSDKDHDGFEDKHAIVSIILEHLFYDLSGQQPEAKLPLPVDTDIHDHQGTSQDEKSNAIHTGGLSDSIITGMLRENPLAALSFALSQNNLTMAESLIPELENALPSEIYLSKALAALVSRGSTLAADRLFTATDSTDYDNLTFSQKNQILGALVSYCNAQDKEIYYLDRIEKKLHALETDADDEGRGSIYNQFARLYHGAYTSDERTEYIDKAKEYAQRAISANPAEPSYHYNLAVILLRCNDLNGAKEAISNCIDGGSQDTDHLSLAYKIFKKANDDRSEQVYQQLEEISPYRAKIAKLEELSEE